MLYYHNMITIRTKQDAINLFNSQKELGDALGISKSAVSQWPDILTQRQINEVVGAAIRAGKINPCELDMENAAVNIAG